MGPPHWQSPLQPEAMTAPQLHAVPTLENSSRPLQQARWPGAPQDDAAAGGAPRPMHTIEASRIVASPPTPPTRYDRGFPHPPFIASPPPFAGHCLQSSQQISYPSGPNLASVSRRGQAKFRARQPDADQTDVVN